jgi:hypothetical protein
MCITTAISLNPIMACDTAIVLLKKGFRVGTMTNNNNRNEKITIIELIRTCFFDLYPSINS